MEIQAIGEHIIVEIEEERDQGGITIVNDEAFYAKGKIISSNVFEAGDGDMVVFEINKSRPLGLDFPNNYRVVLLEYIILRINDELEDTE